MTHPKLTILTSTKFSHYFTAFAVAGLVLISSPFAFYGVVLAADFTPPACPYLPQTGRIIINFDPANSLKKIVSFPTFNNIPDANFSGPVSVSIPAGSYKVSLAASDGYDIRDTVTQLYEQYHLTVEHGGSILASSNNTSDLPDLVKSAFVNNLVNDTGNPMVVPAGGTEVFARHLFADNPPDGSPNSVYPICAALDPLTPPPAALSGSCSGTIQSGGSGDTADWSATASGGTGTYTYSWSGDESLSGTGANITKTYTGTGTKNASVVITSGSQSITKSCAVTVPAPVLPSCPIPAAAGRTIVSFSQSIKLCSYAVGGCVPESGPIGASLPAGQYKVTLASFDSYIGRETVTQAHERWFASVLNGSTQVAASGIIADLADMVRTASSTQVVNDTPNLITIPAGSTGVLAKHAFTGSGETTPNSVFPVCVAFDTINSPTATLKVIKTVINNNGGTKTSADFTLHVKSGSADVSNSPAAGSSAGKTYTLPVGTYVVSEDGPVSGYTMTGISGDCNSAGSVTLVAGDSKICTITNTDIPTPPPSFEGFCAVNPSSGNIGDTFNWSATASGGTGTYTYSWSGDDGLSGTATSTSKTYASVGTKNGSVIITSGSQSITKNCSVVVTTPPPSGGFSGSCSVSPSMVDIGSQVNWSATASGGTGTYTYSWSGDEGLTGSTNSISKSYVSAGTKNGSVVITSGSDTTTASCSVTIKPPPGCTVNCGGGFNPPTVVLYKKALPGTLAFAPFVYLSQVPYTGLSGPMTVTLFFTLIAVWSLAIVSAARSKKFAGTLARLNWHLGGKTRPMPQAREVLDTMADNFDSEGVEGGDLVLDDAASNIDYEAVSNGLSEVPVKSAPAPINLPSGDPGLHLVSKARTAELESELSIRAKQDHALISPDGLKFLIERARSFGASPAGLLDMLIHQSKKLFPREDGWLLLNREKVAEALMGRPVMNKSGDEPIAEISDNTFETLVTPPAEEEKIAKPAISEQVKPSVATPINNVQTIMNEQNNQTNNHSELSPAEDGAARINSFVNILVRGDEVEILGYFRSLRERGTSLDRLSRDTILELDSAFRARLENEPNRRNIVLGQIVSKLSRDDMERIIGILLSIVDKSYNDPVIGAKIASLRISALRNH